MPASLPHYLIGYVRDEGAWDKTVCGRDFRRDSSDINVTGDHRDVTCKGCRRSYTWRQLSSGASKSLYPNYRPRIAIANKES